MREHFRDGRARDGGQAHRLLPCGARGRGALSQADEKHNRGLQGEERHRQGLIHGRLKPDTRVQDRLKQPDCRICWIENITYGIHHLKGTNGRAI